MWCCLLSTNQKQLSVKITWWPQSLVTSPGPSHWIRLSTPCLTSCWAALLFFPHIVPTNLGIDDYFFNHYLLSFHSFLWCPTFLLVVPYCPSTLFAFPLSASYLCGSWCVITSRITFSKSRSHFICCSLAIFLGSIQLWTQHKSEWAQSCLHHFFTWARDFMWRQKICVTITICEGTTCHDRALSIQL